MKYLHIDVLKKADAASYADAKPFSYTILQNPLPDAGYRLLLTSAPTLDQLEPSFGMERKFGQMSHDRYERYDSPAFRKTLKPEWQEFLAELEGPEYRAFLARMFGVRDFTLRFQWQYAVAGGSVSPHCDSVKKVGSHLFYFNDPETWNPAWGGQTQILFDPSGRQVCESAPRDDEFEIVTKTDGYGNQSLLFSRTNNSWHSVSPLAMPPGTVRRLFTVVADKPRTIADTIKGYARVFYKKITGGVSGTPKG
ncbi:MAG: hypothetical protein RLZZ283_4 [Candidatus Parcubacteria bacterium]